MRDFERSVDAFQAAKREAGGAARQMAALHLACGIDLEAAMRLEAAARTPILARLRRAIERERLKGWRSHPGYSLDRHIALKQGLDRLAGRAVARNENGARRAPPVRSKKA